MSQYVPLHLRREIRQRASQLCEYCLVHEDDVTLPHEPDHIIAVKHGGPTTAANLAWTCFLCNRAKGSDIASVDVATGEIIRLVSPRTDKWDEHFEIKGGAIVGKSQIGRVTCRLLQMNRPEQMELRQLFTESRLYPPMTEE